MSADGGTPGVRRYPLPEGDQGAVVWEAARCRHAGECVRGLPEVFDTGKRPWIQPEHAPASDVERVVGLCPSLALIFDPAEHGETAGGDRT
ncbi:(4Fe-4S)-binding protein [Patulibacter minatonensis]|uniref:(4Fe-4S)-binding protein n=1 Tax=Patulibacter minatonensis TaxID=298163 RepID=UPI001B7F817C|nr:(4Fe-4S)-binding protein [Patulibacter minatonensis]